MNINNIGNGVQQHLCEAISADSRMKLIQTAHRSNLKIYRKNISATSNKREQLRQAVLVDTKGVIKRQKKNVKFSLNIKCILVIFVCNITDKLSHNKYLYLPEVMDLMSIIEVSMIGEGKTTR